MRIKPLCNDLGFDVSFIFYFTTPKNLIFQNQKNFYFYKNHNTLKQTLKILCQLSVHQYSCQEQLVTLNKILLSIYWKAPVS